MGESFRPVLLIDDDPHTVAIFELLMQNFRIPFSTMQDPASTLDYLRRHTPGVIVIDLFLPTCDGFQMLTQICEVVNRSTCRILATTAYYTKDTRREVIERGFDGYVPKPFVPDSFLDYLYRA